MARAERERFVQSVYEKWNRPGPAQPSPARTRAAPSYTRRAIARALRHRLQDLRVAPREGVRTIEVVIGTLSVILGAFLWAYLIGNACAVLSALDAGPRLLPAPVLVVLLYA